MEGAKEYIQNKYIINYTSNKGFYYAICFKCTNTPIGYIHISNNDKHDLGYGLKKEFWHKCIVTETFLKIINILKQKL
ncbi:MULTISPECIES: GNAT family N-acetyltransferase [Bacteroidales]|uniref:GNAT family N-acetyltransferase n=1 Tax=Bacteroidales TaxID=171549 RepID=UPI0009ECB1FD|nr:MULTISPECIES: GNAT family N-acetyltransferase [Bacteroidales]